VNTITAEALRSLSRRDFNVRAAAWGWHWRLKTPHEALSDDFRCISKRM